MKHSFVLETWDLLQVKTTLFPHNITRWSFVSSYILVVVSCAVVQPVELRISFHMINAVIHEINKKLDTKNQKNESSKAADASVHQ